MRFIINYNTIPLQILDNAMQKTLTYLGYLVSALSILNLVRIGFNTGYIHPIELMLNWYKLVLNLLLGWLEPYLTTAISRLETILPSDFRLYPNWKYVFILLWIYITSDLYEYRTRRFILSGVITFAVGLFLALVASAISSTVGPEQPSLYPVSFFTIAFFFYEAIKAPLNATINRHHGKTWLQTCNYYLIQFALADLVIGTIILIVGKVAQKYNIPIPNIALSSLYLVGMAVRDVAIGIRHANAAKNTTTAWRTRFRTSATGRHGLAVFKILGAVTVLLAINAGIQ